ncbi:ABC transporter substrate-binding protein [Candidatus Uabimicrobium amorphum]|uniref:ABC transporter permease n=1 Tax=Uabimicrobium amorphum TaxID=2596890 RepID=A0A5S9IIA3_UABAM|nr:ABC transporter substrate-binding protein [Candidatus Uabimicrobium amorphum]BBM82339.1 ABC transporter permease [Candidatus Uabimicrobium amorphum]
MSKIYWLLVLFFLATCGCEKQQQNNLTKVDLYLNWFPEAEHGGFYTALLSGYYKKEGLDVNIVPGGPGTPVLQQVARGNAAFGISNADRVLLARSQEAQIVAVMAPIRKSPRSIMLHKSSRIQKLEDIRDMTLIMSASASFSHYVKYKLPLTGVKIVPYTGNITSFLRDKNSAQQAYIFSEPFIAKSKGVEVKNILVADALGFNPYTSILVTSQQYAQKNSAVVKKMAIASRKGWLKYLQSPQKTNEYIHSINREMSMEILQYGVEQLQPLVFSGLEKRETLGVMEKERWQALLQQMHAAKMLKKENIDIEQVFSNRYLQK